MIGSTARIYEIQMRTRMRNTNENDVSYVSGNVMENILYHTYDGCDECATCMHGGSGGAFHRVPEMRKMPVWCAM